MSLGPIKNIDGVRTYESLLGGGVAQVFGFAKDGSEEITADLPPKAIEHSAAQAQAFFQRLVKPAKSAGNLPPEYIFGTSRFRSLVGKK